MRGALRCVTATVLSLAMAPVASALMEAQESEHGVARLTDFAQPADAAKIDERIGRDIGQVSAGRLRNLLAELTAKPHVAGTPRSREIAAWIAGQFRAAGLQAAVDGYRVVLSYPRSLQLELVGPERLPIDLAEPTTDLDPLVGRGEYPPYNAYSGSGKVVAELVYAGFGRIEDYRELDRQGISVQGRIVLVRLGRLFRGTKVQLAEQHGAAGVILFTDPAEDGARQGAVYPAGPWRPEWSVQRGSVWGGTSFGDPATPRYPSPPAAGPPPFTSDPLPFAAAASPLPPSLAETTARMPHIPSVPVSAANALRLLSRLGGPQAPEGWRGGLPLTYRLGPGPAKARLEVDMELREEDIWNAIGWLPGEEDALLLAGSHHDAWDYGAADSGSGVVATLEAARVLGAAVRAGWRPRRTVMLTAWDGEEFSLIGSSEFAERYGDDIERRAIVMVNLDGPVGGAGGAISANGSPQFASWIELAAERVPDPLEPGTLRTAWLRQEEKPPEGRPVFYFLPAVSDHAAFNVDLGLPAAALGIGEELGVYHSTLDNFQWVARIGDPSFLWHRLLTQWLVAALEIGADAPRLPVVLADYGDRLERDLAEYAGRAGDEQLVRSFSEACAAAAEWRAACRAFDERGRRTLGDPMALAHWNETARGVDRRFLVAEGLHSPPVPRHLLVAPGERTGAGRGMLPSLEEDLGTGDIAAAQAKLERLKDLLRGQVAALVER